MKKQILLDNLEQLETREYTKMTPILVPENFAELKELCKKLNDKIKDIQVSCAYNQHITIQWDNDDNTDIDLYDDGTIYVENHLIAENRTPQQMWQIIKNLIGEE